MEVFQEHLAVQRQLTTRAAQVTDEERAEDIKERKQYFVLQTAAYKHLFEEEVNERCLVYGRAVQLPKALACN